LLTYADYSKKRIKKQSQKSLDMSGFSKSRLVWQTAAILAVLGLSFWISQRRMVALDSGTHTVMGTLARVVVVTPNRDRGLNAIRRAFECIDNIESLMSDFKPDSQLSQVNQRAFLEPVAVEDDLFEVLTASVEYSRLSEGAFDVPIGPVVQLWRVEKQTGVPPSLEALAKAKEAVGWKNLILDPSTKTVRFAREGMHLDLGGIAKGFAVDKAIDVLQQAGMAGGMVDIGGNIRCFGKAANRALHWQIGLQDPRHDQNILMTLNMDGRAVATSGDYRRYAVVNGQKLSHIINPATAQSSQTLSSVTIIAASAMQADALSTAVTVLEEENGLELIETIPNVEAILIQEGALLKSRNADAYILKESR
jgi:thiamine biosynthesis lipoprotein